MGDLQPADECECTNILTTVANLSKSALEVVDVGLKTITMPYLNGEELIVVLLGLPVRGVYIE